MSFSYSWRCWNPQAPRRQGRNRVRIQVEGETFTHRKGWELKTINLNILPLVTQKGKGDVKKQGKLDPYAYIPLKKSQLNRRYCQHFHFNEELASRESLWAQTFSFLFIRKRAKLQGHFKGMVKGAQKGALSGKKMQKRKRKAWKTCSFHCLDWKCMRVGFAITRMLICRFWYAHVFYIAASPVLPWWTLTEQKETPLAAI